MTVFCRILSNLLKIEYWIVIVSFVRKWRRFFFVLFSPEFKKKTKKKSIWYLSLIHFSVATRFSSHLSIICSWHWSSSDDWCKWLLHFLSLLLPFFQKTFSLYLIQPEYFAGLVRARIYMPSALAKNLALRSFAHTHSRGLGGVEEREGRNFNHENQTIESEFV